MKCIIDIASLKIKLEDIYGFERHNLYDCVHAWWQENNYFRTYKNILNIFAGIGGLMTVVITISSILI